MENEETILLEATFSPKVKMYIFIVVLFYLFISFIGIILIPFWLLGLGQWLSAKFFNTLKCQLTNKNLRFSKGLIIHVEKTIPLENIQDLSFIGGPLLRSFGLTMIRVETAGGGGAQQTNMMSMIGVDEPEKFKATILKQREKAITNKYSQHQPDMSQESREQLDVLKDIRSTLHEIKLQLGNKSSQSVNDL